MERIIMGFRGMRFVVHVMLWEIFGGEMEKLTEGWRKLYWTVGELDLWCMWC